MKGCIKTSSTLTSFLPVTVNWAINFVIISFFSHKNKPVYSKLILNVRFLWKWGIYYHHTQLCIDCGHTVVLSSAKKIKFLPLVTF